MADPVYLEPGISDNPIADADPNAMGLQSTLGQQVGYEARVALDTLPSQGIYDYTMTHLGADPMISGTEANQRFGIAGTTPENTLKWDPNEQVGTGQAEQMQKVKSDQIQESLVMATRPSSWQTNAASIGIDVLAGPADPSNVAFSIIPESALGRVADIAARFAGTEEAAAAAAKVSAAMSDTVIGRALNSGINNAAGVALLQPIIQAGAEQDHQDYGWAQAGQNILFGGLVNGSILHGIGEGVHFLSGSTWRNTMRSGIASLDNDTAAGLISQDLANADRSSVMKDLTTEDGVQPSEAAIAQEMTSRQQGIYDNVANGKYFNPLPEQEPINENTLPPDEIADLASKGDYANAAPAMAQHVASLESELGLNLDENEKALTNQPVEQFQKLKSIINDFTSCVAQEAAL